ncbi:hypothetical protein BpHYR1_033681 [Brachionus plicatilis]|uniref:Uncharacterized protein n=1 Tax=Brachionus plicatilis TaxID=10195 RepID=A0A3M7Q7K8_BRAPC|nr:hypothetical protein BpHYR1_033681 [Brachionus plicatilis]
MSILSSKWIVFSENVDGDFRIDLVRFIIGAIADTIGLDNLDDSAGSAALFVSSKKKLLKIFNFLKNFLNPKKNQTKFLTAHK